MARYLQTAETARNEMNRWIEGAMPDGPTGPVVVTRREVIALCIRMANYGIRMNPRACQSTVRERALQTLAAGSGLDVRLVEHHNPDGRSYKAIDIKPLD